MTARTTTWLLPPLLAIGAAWMAGCASPSSASGDPIVIGAVYNLSGAQADLDVPSAHGAQLAVDEANRAGGVLGRPVDLALVDGRTDPSMIRVQTASILHRHPQTAAVIGLSDTDMVLAAAPVAARGGRLFLTSGATSPQLPAQVPIALYLACFGDNVQAAAAAEWAFDDLRARTAAVLYDSTATYTELLQRYFRDRFESLGGRIVLDVPYAPDAIPTIAPIVTTADVVFLAAHVAEDAVPMIARLRTAGVAAPIIGGDGFDSEHVWRENPAVSNVYYTTHAYLGADSTDPRVIAFRTAYRGAHPDEDPDAFTALGYDAAGLVLRAIADAGTTDPERVRMALSRIASFDGVTGTMRYLPGERIPMKSVSIIGVSDGSLRLAAQWMPAVVPAP